MRLWHQSLISLLPRQQLLGQHRECCALRGKGWGRKHSVVDYVFTHKPECLVAYHYLVMDEMKKRGYNPDETWYNCDFRGNVLGMEKGYCDTNVVCGFVKAVKMCDITIYPEHNDAYLQECLDNLAAKGIKIEIEEKYK